MDTLRPKPSIIVWMHPKEKKLLRQRMKSGRTNGGAAERLITGTGGGLTSVMKVFLAASEREVDRETVVSHRELEGIHYSTSVPAPCVTLTRPTARSRQAHIME